MEASTISAYKCTKKKGALEPFTYQKKNLGDHDVFVSITHCGICHSDLHLIDDDWNFTNYPLVPGHEIIGIVEEKGSLVDHLEVGERVGIGWQRTSCMKCSWCLQGDENLCSNQQATCVNHFGGFGDGIVADGRFAFPIPKELPSEFAAPLMCGGATVYSPFIEHKINATKKVAILGIGGLGHIAIQFAKAFGCEVWALSTSKEKEKEAYSFGANHFVLMDELDQVTNSFDFILSSSSSDADWSPLIQTLRPRGTLCLLGGLEKEFHIPIAQLVDGRKMVSGSNIGSRPVIKQMLETAALHHIHPQIELFPIEQVNEAILKLKNGKMRYRAVLTT